MRYTGLILGCTLATIVGCGSSGSSGGQKPNPPAPTTLPTASPDAGRGSLDAEKLSCDKLITTQQLKDILGDAFTSYNESGFNPNCEAAPGADGLDVAEFMIWPNSASDYDRTLEVVQEQVANGNGSVASMDVGTKSFVAVMNLPLDNKMFMLHFVDSSGANLVRVISAGRQDRLNIVRSIGNKINENISK